jgi:electron transport complex protein RnfA
VSWIGIILISVFSANVLFTYGLGSCAILRKARSSVAIDLLSLLLTNFIVSALLWSFDALVLRPLGLGVLKVIVFALIIAPLTKFLSQLAGSNSGSFSNSLLGAIDESTLSCLVFGIALIVTNKDYGLGEALVASIASALGYFSAVLLLDSVRRRMEISGIPTTLRNGPAILISAGLMAMAFSGIDRFLVVNLVK